MGHKEKTGHLPMWEVAKAVAFDRAIDRIVKHTKQPAAELLGMRKDDFIAQELRFPAGGHPTIPNRI